MQLIVFLYIIGVLGTHQPVPYTKVQTIVAFELTMVEVVMHGCIQYFKQPAIAKPFWGDLITQMPINVDNEPGYCK